MRRVLAAAGHADEEIRGAVGRLRAAGYLDDGALASRFARSRIEGHGLGRRRVREALRVRGVPRAVAEVGVAEALAEVSEGAALEREARKYWGRHAREEPRRRIAKLWAFLLRRGFPGELVRERLVALWPRWGDALEGLEPVDAADETGACPERDD